MPTSRSRSASVREDEELRLPRPPGVIRQFWARHPLAVDICTAAVCLVLSLIPATTISASQVSSGESGLSWTTTPLAWAPIPVAVIAASVLLVWRRRWPLVAFIASLVVAVSYLFAPVPIAGPLLLVTSYSLAVYRSTRACWTSLAIGLGVLTTLALTLAVTGTVPFQISLNAIVGEMIVGLIGALIGVNVGNRRRYIEAVIARSHQLLRERDQHAELAASAERARIAREMHDIVSHSLTVIVALSDGAVATTDRTRAREAMDAVAGTARGALTEMRAMLGVLRANDPSAPLEPPEPASPRATVDAAYRAGFPVSLAVIGDRPVSQPVRYAIGRIVQEGVTNAMRHAPGALAIAVRIDYTSDPVIVEVRNDAAHGPDRTDGFGLRGLHERTTHVGGIITSGRSGESGWMLHAELPADHDDIREHTA